MARNVYMTAGKKRLIEFMTENKDRHFSVDEIAEELPGVGKSSVYRMVSKLHQEGVLRRFETEGMSSFVYQFVEQNEACEHHFHLKCADCGKIIHMECHELEKVKKHIEAEHGFSIGVKNSMIYGICQDCRSGESRHHRKGCKCSACKCVVSVVMVLVLLFSLLLSGCTGGVAAENDGKLKIVTTIFPQYDFVREILGEEIINDPDSNAEVSLLIKPGAESHTFMPSTEDMLKIEQCDLLICVGGETDSWVDEEILPSVDMSKKKVLYLT
ncbi:MAG: transcriptional repressor, partial [Clostridia bacterium]|nr:transcriptional repressor [Clostridia bacterium]